VAYEAQEPWPLAIESTAQSEKDYRVEKMKFGKSEDGEKDKSTIIYNAHIKIKNIPLQAFDYVVNGKAAIEWVMERQGVKTEKNSQIINDANSYALETMKDARYPLLLLQRVVRVAMETMKIVHSLPKLVVQDIKKAQAVKSEEFAEMN
jgi:predicted helicase